jgi:hypothetical protein
MRASRRELFPLEQPDPRIVSRTRGIHGFVQNLSRLNARLQILSLEIR